ncbi:MAG: sugar phosphate isomerase/epimerase [Anaerolineae bacterium]|nr:sugar phosphate isomerase/epimerase [Gemmatimonadaceae bacterium]
MRDRDSDWATLSAAHLLDRRAFLGTVGMAALGCSMSKEDDGKVPAADTSAQVGVRDQTGTRTLDRIGVQLYTLRDDMEKDLEGTLARVAAIGYKDVEFAGYFTHSAADIRRILDKNGLRAPAAHIGTPAALTKDWDKMLDNAKVAGHDYLIVAYLTDEERRSLDDYRKHADLFNKAGETAKKAGVRLAYHNHDFEFVRKEDKVPYDILLERTDPALVAMELDLFWITKSGNNPQAYFERYPGRFELVHVKDMDASPEQRMVDVGKGSINFAQIFAQREKAGIRHFMVEHDNPQPSALESVKASYEYLSRLKY